MFEFLKDQKKVHDMTKAMRAAETYQALKPLSDAELAKLVRWVCKEFKRWSGGYNPDLKIEIKFRWHGLPEDGWYAFFYAGMGEQGYSHKFRFPHQVFKSTDPLSVNRARFNEACEMQAEYAWMLARTCLDALVREYGSWVNQQLVLDQYHPEIVSPGEIRYCRSQE